MLINEKSDNTIQEGSVKQIFSEKPREKFLELVHDWSEFKAKYPFVTTAALILEYCAELQGKEAYKVAWFINSYPDNGIPGLTKQVLSALCGHRLPFKVQAVSPQSEEIREDFSGKKTPKKK